MSKTIMRYFIIWTSSFKDNQGLIGNGFSFIMQDSYPNIREFCESSNIRSARGLQQDFIIPNYIQEVSKEDWLSAGGELKLKKIE